MTKVSHSSLYILVLLIVMSCVEIIDFSSDGQVEMPYVNGYITDTYGYQTILVGKLIPFTTYDSSHLAGAEVYVDDSEGNRYDFDETGDEYISQTEFAAIEDIEYTLHVTIDGIKYTSTPQVLQPGQEIQNFTYREDSIQVINLNGDLATSEGIRLSMDIDNPDTKTRFYKISVNYTFIFDAFKLPESHPNKRCYNYIPPSEYFLLENSQSGYTFDLGYYEFSRKFEYKISYQVTQITMNKEAYDFWEEVQIQGQSTGSLFDTPPYTIRGNISATDPENQIRGFFGVYSIRQERIYLNEHDLSYVWDPTLHALECNVARIFFAAPHCYDCRLNPEGPNRSTVKPDWWQ